MRWAVKLLEIRSVCEATIEAPTEQEAIQAALNMAKAGALHFITTEDGEMVGLAVPFDGGGGG